ncbi:hypothetical protein GCM10011352_36260 [Marinobacterium zhoushanense]|uniref:Nitroreductase domain-containing protein n=1 Tax=Marinobacterium zhoushanense TaxID=1679163 RepID=A0ABQ1KTL8_9GAMM|nr:nitroreductase family protein [Marinobacterium zhoushanense]GGC06773.1 hypothetical protein GCM10011352_36260 [Marinobacterium zhoushanense]
MLDLTKNIIRPVRDLISGFVNFLYDYSIYCQNSSSIFRKSEKITYEIIKTYHALEKSMTFSPHDKYAGGGVALKLYKLLCLKNSKYGLGVMDKIGGNVLLKYLVLSENKESDFIRSQDLDWLLYDDEKGGIKKIKRDYIQQGMFEKPEDFFLTRFSIRDFLPQHVPKDLLLEAISLAIKTPSSCNRQPWLVHLVSDEHTKNKILDIQFGNRGFGHKIPNILVISMNSSAYTTACERYQYWIDGGMFCMSLIYALHAKGLGTCCLNWSQEYKNDLKIKKIIEVDSSNRVIMIIAVGYIADEVSVCRSDRKSIDDIVKVVER